MTFVIILVLFTIALVVIGLRSRAHVEDTDDFIIAGRGIGFWMNVLNTISIGFAGTAIAFNPGFTIMFGFRDSLIFGFVVAIVGYCGYGLICGKFVRTCGAQTLAEWVETRYSRRTRNIISIGGIIGLTGILANNIVSMVGVIQSYTGWPGWIIMTVSYLIIISFAYFAGMWGISTTGFFQMIIGIIVVPAIAVLCLTTFGGLEFISANWQGSLWANGISGMAMPRLAISYPSYFSLVVLFGFFLIWGSNYYWLRLASCRTEKVSRDSFTLAGVLMMLIFYVPLSFMGLYAGAISPEVFTLGGGTIAPTASYGVLGTLFPTIISSLMIISAITAAVSTAATSLIGATATATRDIYGRIVKPGATGEETLKATRIIILLIGGFTWLIGLYPGGPTYLFAFSTAWLGPPAILLAFGMFWPRFNERGAYSGTMAGIISMSILTILDLINVIPLSQHTHVGLIGLVVTVLVSVIVSLSTKAPYYGEASWSLRADSTNREKVNLDETDKKVMSLIRTGHVYMSDLVDALEIDASECNNSIEKLDRGGYIEREGLTGSGFNTFNITQKGIDVLPELDESEERLNSYKLTPLYLEIMQEIEKGHDSLVSYIRTNKLSSLVMSSIVSHLTRLGYISERGLTAAEYSITDEGKKIMDKVGV